MINLSIHTFGILFLYGIEKLNIFGTINKYVFYATLRIYTYEEEHAHTNCEMLYS